MTHSNSPLSFPVLDDCLVEPWHWPAPPFVWRHVEPPDLATAQPCLVEAPRGVGVEGFMLGFDPGTSSITFQSPTTGPAGRLSFRRFRRLTVTTPLEPAPGLAGAPIEAVPSAAQERDYRIASSDAAEPDLSGRTLGHVETAEGLFLFTPVEGERTLLRVFVPRCAYTVCEFGESAQEIAAKRWITGAPQLLEAIEHQRRMPVQRIGQSLLELGLITPVQLERGLAASDDDIPLGERLVKHGTITSADLQTALAHKMGYPLVDLRKFPVDPDAAALLPKELALRYKTLALMTDQNRLIVAVDRPQRLTKVQALSKFSGWKLVPVLASKHELMNALARMTQQDPWFQNVAARPGFFATTE